jgi:hypothetical protein
VHAAATIAAATGLAACDESTPAATAHDSDSEVAAVLGTAAASPHVASDGTAAAPQLAGALPVHHTQQAEGRQPRRRRPLAQPTANPLDALSQYQHLLQTCQNYCLVGEHGSRGGVDCLCVPTHKVERVAGSDNVLLEEVHCTAPRSYTSHFPCLADSSCAPCCRRTRSMFMQCRWLLLTCPLTSSTYVTAPPWPTAGRRCYMDLTSSRHRRQVGRPLLIAAGASAQVTQACSQWCPFVSLWWRAVLACRSRAARWSVRPCQGRQSARAHPPVRTTRGRAGSTGRIGERQP